VTTYTHPVLDADRSDPDVVRVGDDSCLTASGFGRAPGLPSVVEAGLRLDGAPEGPGRAGAATFTRFRIRITTS
jgi:hypothetical protein